MRGRMAFALGAVIVAILGAQARAHACGAFYDAAERRRVTAPKPAPPPVPTQDEALIIADTAMEQDAPRVAAAALLKAFARVRPIPVEASKRDVRALHLMAVALARTNGFAPDAKTRAANLDWAIATLRDLAQAHGDDPIVRAELGEALAKVPAHRAEALALLSSLAERDLLASARAYGELAKLRAAQGDPRGAASAADRCRAMSLRAAVCPTVRPAPSHEPTPGV
jgi:hypothetical protein